MTKLVCVLGKKRSGKDTIADYINKRNDAKIYKLAYPIKEALAASCDELSFEDMDGLGVDREMSLGYNSSRVVEILKKCLAHNGLEYEDIEGFVSQYDESSWSIRTLMQRYGTDLVCNKIDHLFWTKLAFKFYYDTIKHDYKTRAIIIPDVRQPWEIESLKMLNCVVIHVQRDMINNTKDIHSTEKGLPVSKGDFVVKNDGSVDELYEKVNKILKETNL